MAFNSEELKEKVTRTGKQAVNKTKELTEIAKIKLFIAAETRKISASYKKLGRAYYESQADCTDKLLSDEFDVINEAKANIEEYKARIRELKGTVVCDGCGHEVDKDVKFCPKCGMEIASSEDALAEIEE